ncbi:DUF493 domain-containing protein [Flavobacteriaceae bacterium]|nr:DUF493 domain-containing protein [Flavobacteriaceae bacterium]MDB4239523.1 DUF493 domain-containing protein [Flavobacteriaceae bacterium]MDC0958565.1 DUF493 domain-containing protein [Flavobacteriaceae bacterium]
MQNKQLIVLSTYICHVNNDNNDFYERLEKQLSESSSWPSLYRFKFIIKSDIKNIEQLKSIFSDVKNTDISSRNSSSNRFTSFSITAVMKSPSFIIKKYKLASKIKGIISL